MRAVSRTDTGKVRKQNEDAVFVSSRLFAVADGMGGHKGGKEASRIALKTLAESLKDKAPDKNELIRAMEAANRRIYETQLKDESLSGMGSTLSVIWADETDMLVGHVGDSRVYLLRQGELNQVTQDHSLVAELMQNGYITREEAAHYPYRNVITRAIGTNKMVLPDIFKIPSQPLDKWLICSDGLHGLVDAAQILQILSNCSLDEAADQLLQKALDNGGSDNVSLVLIDCGEAAR